MRALLLASLLSLTALAPGPGNADTQQNMQRDFVDLSGGHNDYTEWNKNVDGGIDPEVRQLQTQSSVRVAGGSA
jgi:hypothetical protein